eukprot:766921-Hanusia_phi.AAC.6
MKRVTSIQRREDEEGEDKNVEKRMQYIGRTDDKKVLHHLSSLLCADQSNRSSYASPGTSHQNPLPSEDHGVARDLHADTVRGRRDSRGGRASQLKDSSQQGGEAGAGGG